MEVMSTKPKAPAQKSKEFFFLVNLISFFLLDNN